MKKYGVYLLLYNKPYRKEPVKVFDNELEARKFARKKNKEMTDPDRRDQFSYIAKPFKVKDTKPTEEPTGNNKVNEAVTKAINLIESRIGKKVELVEAPEIEEVGFIQLGEKITNALEKYLASKGLDVQLEFSIERNRYYRCKSQIFKGAQLGIFKYGMTDCFITCWGGDLNVERDTIWLNMKLEYNHISGGSNGCDFCINYEDSSLWYSIAEDTIRTKSYSY